MGRTIKQYGLLSLLLSTVLIGCATLGSRSGGGTSGEPFLSVRVDKNKLVTEDGKDIIFRGVNVYDPMKLSSQGFYNEKYFQQAASWGANIVRHCVHPKAWSTTDRTVALGTLEQAISWSADAGMYSIIDWHSIGMPTRNLFEGDMGVTTTQETIEFWQLMAKTYKGDKRVAFYELFNEPTLMDSSATAEAWVELRDWMQKVIDAVRAIDPDKPIIVAGLDWAYNLKEVKANPVGRDNIAFSVHPYPQKGLPWNDYFGYLKDEVAFINTEFGFDNANAMMAEEAYTKAGGTGRYRDEIIKYFEDNKMSWVAWSYTPDWAPALFKDRVFTPTEWGGFLKETMLRLNQGPTPRKADAAKYVHTNILDDLKKANESGALSLAAKKKTVALSSESDQLGPDKAVDGNKSTRWASAFKQDPTWMYVDLEKETDIKKVVIYWEVAYSVEFKIQVSNDAKEWTDVKHVQGSKGGIEELEVSAKGRYLRVFAMKRATEWGTSIWELQVY